MSEYQTWREYLIEKLAADRERAIDYLDVALEEYQADRDIHLFLVALRTVVEAQGGVSEVAERIGIAPQLLSDVLSSEKAPRLDTLNTILQALGCRLSIQPLKDANASTGKDDSVAPRESTDPNLEISTENSGIR